MNLRKDHSHLFTFFIVNCCVIQRVMKACFHHALGFGWLGTNLFQLLVIDKIGSIIQFKQEGIPASTQISAMDV